VFHTGDGKYDKTGGKTNATKHRFAQLMRLGALLGKIGVFMENEITLAFEIEFSPDAFDQLRSFRKHDQAVIADAIQRQLSQTPLLPTRQRKPMRSNKIATWELRTADFRVYYDVDTVDPKVLIRAIGIKRRNEVFIGGEKVDLT
jgi:mRNA-degrading endonuclease RelE of RelBE toxin-antitoxin system